MILGYGTFRHALGEASLSISRETVLSPSGMSIGWRERWQIGGRLQAPTSAELTSAIEALTAAYAIDDQDVVLYLPDGVTPTAHKLLNASTQGGVRVSRRPSFPIGDGAEYSTFRTYVIELEALFASATEDAELLAWDETLTITQPASRWVYLATLTGPSVRQQVQEVATAKATQTGRAVGLRSYPTPADPIWPDAWHQDQGGVTRKLPRRSGTADVEYEVRWQYQFESGDALDGLPTPRGGV